MKHDLLKSSYAALLEGAREAVPDIDYHANGYAPTWQLNLWRQLPLVAIAGDLAKGVGSELNSKLKAAHSSAALAVNTFGPWRESPYGLKIGGAGEFSSLRFEAICRTGLRGTPPHLDVLAEGDLIVAIESKCTEWMTQKDAKFGSSYDLLRKTHEHSPWFSEVALLRKHPKQYRFLDAAQLTKHALGLTTLYGAKRVQLMYLYWEPRNVESWAQCLIHRAEAEDLAARVSDPRSGLINV